MAYTYIDNADKLRGRRGLFAITPAIPTLKNPSSEALPSEPSARMNGIYPLTLALAILYGGMKLVRFWNAIRSVKYVPPIITVI